MGRYKEILTCIAPILKLRVEEKILARPKRDVDIIYEVYVTNAPKDKETPPFSFGFWTHGETEDKVYKHALMRLIPNLKWTYKNKIKKWLYLK